MNPVGLLVAGVQGARLRRTTERLPPAGGPTTGSLPGPGRTALRVLVIGDSTAAGVGTEHHEEALVGALAREAAAGAPAPVDWQVIGRAGATARRVRYTLLPRLEPEPRFDLAVVLVGVNDVLAGRSVQEWRADVAAILDRVDDRADLTVLAGVPPFDRFPSMPPTLGRHLARRGGRLDAAARRLCRERGIVWLDSTALLPDDPDFFARDGFHPSPTGYALWARTIWRHVAAELITSTT